METPLARYVEKTSSLREKKSVVVERELTAIYKKHDGLTPEIILSEAAAPDHPLHNNFEWDDSKAGHKYRLVQATQMILASKFVCVLQEQHGDVPQIVGTVRKLLPESRGGKFRMRNEVIEKADTRALFVERKRSELKTWCRSVVDVSELDATRKAIESLITEAA